jgi:hypothetical protein
MSLEEESAERGGAVRSTNDLEAGSTQPQISDIYLVGLRTDGRSEVPNFYTFLLEQNQELRPLLVEDQVILFTHLELAPQAFALAGIPVQFRRPPSLENVYLIDAARTLHLLAYHDEDNEQVIANFLDWCARTLTALGIPLPPAFDVLADLGKHVDQHGIYRDFLGKEPYRRERAIDGVRWCLGTIFSLARILTKE